MGRTTCTEPQCLYKGALYLYLTPAYFGSSLQMVAPSVFVQDEFWDWLQRCDSLLHEVIMCPYITLLTIDTDVI
jgi:hypothetical protein